MNRYGINPNGWKPLASKKSYPGYLDVNKVILDTLHENGYPVYNDCCIDKPSVSDIGKVLTIGADGIVLSNGGSGGSGITNLSIGNVTNSSLQIVVTGGTNFLFPIATNTKVGLITGTLFQFLSQLSVSGFNSQKSIIGNGLTPYSLVNDLQNPGGNKYYGTNLAGDKGWYEQPNASGITNLSVELSPVAATIVSSSGSDAVIPLANSLNAGLLSPSLLTKLNNLPSSFATVQANRLFLGNGTESPTSSADLTFNSNTKVLLINGKAILSGIVNSLGVELTPTNANPGDIDANTLWINSGNNHLFFGSVDLQIAQGITIDAIPTNNSNNAVSSNGTFDALQLRVPVNYYYSKGVILVASAPDEIGALGVGANNKFLKTNSSTLLGVEWADAPGISLNRVQVNGADIKYFILSGNPTVNFTKIAGQGTITVTGGAVEIDRVQITELDTTADTDGSKSFTLTVPTPNSGTVLQYPIGNIINAQGGQSPSSASHLYRNTASAPALMITGGTAGTNIIVKTGDLTLAGTIITLVLKF